MASFSRSWYAIISLIVIPWRRTQAMGTGECKDVINGMFAETWWIFRLMSDLSFKYRLMLGGRFGLDFNSPRKFIFAVK
jgi:hypothetical protein